MQRLDDSLAAYLQDGPADSSVLRVFHRVLAAVEAIHAAGKAHPPLSPHTIRFDNSGQPHIPCSSRAHEIADTVAFGSAKYSAPEAFLFNGDGSCCESADCYVLGFIFYEILAGKRLWVAQFAALENGPSSLWLKWHANRAARIRPLSELRPSLGYFARIIDGMLEKDSSKRINSISQVLHGFSSVEAQTTYQSDPVLRADPTREVESFRKNLKGSAERHGPVRKSADFPRRAVDVAAVWRGFVSNARAAAARIVIWFATLSRLQLGVGVLLAIVISVSTIVFVRSYARSGSVRRPSASGLPAIPPAVKSASKEPPASPIGRQPVGEVQVPAAIPAKAESSPSIPAQAELSLEVESHLSSSALLFLDDLQPMTLARNRVLVRKTSPGPHKIRFVAHGKPSLSARLNIGSDGDVSFVELPKAHLLRYVLLASSANSARLYATSDARARLPGQPYQAVPEDGLVIANNQIVTVSSTKNAKTHIHLNPSPAGSIRVVLLQG